MCLNEYPLRECEAFLNTIANEKDDEKLWDAINSMHDQIEHMERTGMWDEAEVLIDYLDDVWSLVSAKEKKENNMLVSCYEGIKSDLEISAGYHDDDHEPDEYDDDDFYDEE